MGQDVSVYNFLLRVSDKTIYTQAAIVIYCLFATPRGLAFDHFDRKVHRASSPRTHCEH